MFVFRDNMDPENGHQQKEEHRLDVIIFNFGAVGIRGFDCTQI